MTQCYLITCPKSVIDHRKKRATESSLRTLLIVDPKYRSFVRWNLPRSGTSRVLRLTTGQIRTLADLGGGAGNVQATGLCKGWQESWATHEQWKCRWFTSAVLFESVK